MLFLYERFDFHQSLQDFLVKISLTISYAEAFLQLHKIFEGWEQIVVRMNENTMIIKGTSRATHIIATSYPHPNPPPPTHPQAPPGSHWGTFLDTFSRKGDSPVRFVSSHLNASTMNKLMQHFFWGISIDLSGCITCATFNRYSNPNYHRSTSTEIVARIALETSVKLPQHFFH